MPEVNYDGRMFGQLMSLKKEIETLLITIEAITTDMTLKGITIDQKKRFEKDMNSYYSELKKLTLN